MLKVENNKQCMYGVLTTRDVLFIIVYIESGPVQLLYYNRCSRAFEFAG